MYRSSLAREVTIEGVSFGLKRPPLYSTIKDILKEYPRGQIFKVSRQCSVKAENSERPQWRIMTYHFIGDNTKCR